MALTTDVSGSTSDSYCTVLEADSYLSWRDIESWENATEAKKEGVLKAAVSVMDELLYDYPKADADQALRLPTSSMVESSGDVYMPERVKRAQAYLAAYLLDDPDLLAGSGNVRQVSVSGAFSVTMAEGSNGDTLPADVLGLLERYLYKGGPTLTSWDSARRGYV